MEGWKTAEERGQERKAPGKEAGGGMAGTRPILADKRRILKFQRARPYGDLIIYPFNKR